jgi:peptidoglycan/LPS O-acetylase OafA/YrhL
MRRTDITSLTGLRGVAALWVVAYHLLLPASLIQGGAARIAGRGYLAVDIFFLLSGFVMALNYGARFRSGFDAAAFADFLWRRFARLYPLYGAILAARLVYTVWRYGGFDLPRPWIAVPVRHPWTDIPANLAMLQSWGLAPSLIGPSWSISTEWAAYVAFPLLATSLLFRGRRAAAACAAAACGLVVATALLLAGTGAHGKLLDAWNGETAGPLMRCFGGFALGMALWRLSQWPPAASFARNRAVAGGVIIAIAALVGSAAPDLALYPAFAALVLCLGCGTDTPAAAFGWRPLVWLGEISYSLYLLHIFLLHPIDMSRATLDLLLPPGPADVATCVLIGGLLLAASDLAYRCIERPGRALLLRFAPAAAQCPARAFNRHAVS